MHVLYGRYWVNSPLFDFPAKHGDAVREEVLGAMTARSSTVTKLCGGYEFVRRWTITSISSAASGAVSIEL